MLKYYRVQNAEVLLIMLLNWVIPIISLSQLFLYLNNSKFEIILFGPFHVHPSGPQPWLSVNQCTACSLNLGVLFDSDLSVDAEVKEKKFLYLKKKSFSNFTYWLMQKSVRSRIDTGVCNV